MHAVAPTRFSTSKCQSTVKTVTAAEAVGLRSRTRRRGPYGWAWLLVLGGVVTASPAGAADDASAPKGANEPGREAVQQPAVLQGTAAQAAEMDKPLRGASMQAHIGGGYMVFDRKIAANPQFPQLTGRNELLGAGPSLAVTLGVDVLEWLSLQLTGGMTLSGARRQDYVHSLMQSFGAIGVRFAIPFRDRWKVNLTPAIAYVRQDNEVDVAQTGVGLMGQAGVEYYAHVRHFSLGADLAIQVPLTPTRVFIGVMPHVRYTF